VERNRCAGRTLEALKLVDGARTAPEHGRVQRTLSRRVGGPFDDDDGRGGPSFDDEATAAIPPFERIEIGR
jgi:hypothetical protein